MIFFFFVAMVAIPVDQPQVVDLTGIKCIVTGNAASLSYSSKYKKGEVYFDCNSSRLKFESNPAKYSSKANHQLVVTSQYVQTHCPMKLSPVGPEDGEILLAGVKLKICCPSCRKFLDAKTSKQQQMEAVFSNKSFNKSFTPVKSVAK